MRKLFCSPLYVRAPAKCNQLGLQSGPHSSVESLNKLKMRMTGQKIVLFSASMWRSFLYAQIYSSWLLYEERSIIRLTVYELEWKDESTFWYRPREGKWGEDFAALASVWIVNNIKSAERRSAIIYFGKGCSLSTCEGGCTKHRESLPNFNATRSPNFDRLRSYYRSMR